MIQWLKDIFDRRLYVIKYDFIQSGVHMAGTSRILPRRKLSAQNIADGMNAIYGPGTHWIEVAL